LLHSADHGPENYVTLSIQKTLPAAHICRLRHINFTVT